MVLHRIPSLMRGLVGKWKQLFIFRSLSLDGGILLIVLCRDDTSLAFTSNRKCCSQCIKTVNNICTGLRLMVSANFLCPIAISDSQKPLKLRDARPVSLAGCRRLILINMISNAASVKPKSVRRHRLQITQSNDTHYMKIGLKFVDCIHFHHQWCLTSVCSL